MVADERMWHKRAAWHCKINKKQRSLEPTGRADNGSPLSILSAVAGEALFCPDKVRARINGCSLLHHPRRRFTRLPPRAEVSMSHPERVATASKGACVESRLGCCRKKATNLILCMGRGLSVACKWST